MIKEAIQKLSNKEDISYDMAAEVMNEIMSNDASPVQMSAYLTALSLKGETIDEITASAAVMRQHSVKLVHNLDVLEIVGTGGDHANTFNISTTTALVVAAAGVPIAKHGNRAASSQSGAADMLEALGVNIDITTEQSTKLLNEIGICFLYAPNYHLSMKYVAPVRRELGTRSIFNILGPLTNPAAAKMQLLGVFDQDLVLPLAQVLQNLGLRNAMVVHGQDGLDEISVSAPTAVCEIKNDHLDTYIIAPEDFGIERASKADLIGGTPQENAAITRAILSGEKGAKRDAILINSGAALYVANSVQTIEDGVKMAALVLDNGLATEKLEEFIAYSNQTGR